MKFPRQIIPSWGVETIGLLVLLVGSPFFLFGGVVVGAIWAKRRAIGPGKRWSRWFAWYPVRVDFQDSRWLEMVERRSTGMLADTHYRATDGRIA